MQYANLGKTGIKISRVGLGCSGPSRLGLAAGGTPAEAIRLIHLAFDLGVNLIDTSGAMSGTDEIIAKAVHGRRADAVLSTKINLSPAIGPMRNSRFFSRAFARVGAEFSYVAHERLIRRRIDQMLSRLGTDHVDVLSLHSVTPGQYHAALTRCLPLLERLKKDGKIRAYGVSEAFSRDPSHTMLKSAIGNQAFEVMMAGFNIFNQSAEKTVFSSASKRGIGTIGMFAVRRMLKNEMHFRQLVDRINRGPGQVHRISADALLSTMVRHGVTDVAEAAYRFCAHQSGADTMLVGTGNPEHLRRNVLSYMKGDLPPEIVTSLRDAFGSIDYLTAG